MESKSIFPNIEIEGNGQYTKQSPFDGLTKRELFAGMAMQGFCSLSPDDCEALNLTPENVANMSVAHADALIKALEKAEE